MKKNYIIYFTLIALLLGFLFASCLGPGIITQTSGDDPTPGPIPTPVSTPTSWYIQNVFSGNWSYQFFDGDTAVQTYKVSHSVFNNGQLRMKFVDIKTGFTNFNAEGVIDMNTGAFFAQGNLATIGPVNGDIELYGTFATDTISEYTADQVDFFTAPDKTTHKYTIQTIRYNQ